MEYDFDRIIDRRGTGSVRWDNNIKKTGEPDLIPLTTADMDFRAPDAVCEAVRKSAEFGIFGYTQPKDSYYGAVIKRFAERWHWDIQKEWITYSAGVVGAIAFCIQGMTAPGDAVCILTPVYHPFAHVIADNGRRAVQCELMQSTGKIAEIDFERLEETIVNEHVKMIIFCNPHNPVGRAWTADELDTLSGIAVKHRIIVISDEIHCDFVYSGHSFHSLAASMEKKGGEDLLIICSAASKSYNIAGLQTSEIIIPDKRLRKAYTSILMKQHYMELNCIGPAAAEAAYTYGGGWLNAVRSYLEGTRDIIAEYFKSEDIGIRPVLPEATFMMWLDYRGTGMEEDEFNRLLIHKARVALNMGSSFGDGGEGYVRINFAVPRALIIEALQRIKSAVRGAN